MGVHKVRRRLAVKGKVTIGGDATLMRTATNVLGLNTEDRLDLSRGGAGTPQLAIDSGTALIGTAQLGGINGAIILRANTTGTPCLAFKHANGTVYALYFNPVGGAVTGTPVTS